MQKSYSAYAFLKKQNQKPTTQAKKKNPNTKQNKPQQNPKDDNKRLRKSLSETKLQVLQR